MISRMRTARAEHNYLNQAVERGYNFPKRPANSSRSGSRAVSPNSMAFLFI